MCSRPRRTGMAAAQSRDDRVLIFRVFNVYLELERELNLCDGFRSNISKSVRESTSWCLPTVYKNSTVKLL